MDFKFVQDASDDLLRTYEMTVTPDEYEAMVVNIYGFLAMQIGIDVTNTDPEDGLKVRYGDKYEFEVAKCLCNQLTDQLIEQEDLPAALEPDFEGVEDFKRGEPFTFTAHVHVKPYLTLSSYEPVEIEVPDFDITEKVMEDYIAKELEDKATLEKDEEATTVTDGTTVLITVFTKKHGMNVGPLCATDAPYTVGSPELPDIYDEKLKAMKPGETLVFDFDLTSKNFLGMDVEEHMDATLELQSILRKDVPKLTDEWVRDNVAGAHDVKTYRELVRTSLQMQGEQQRQQMTEQAAMAALANRLESYEFPAEYYEYSRAGLLQNMSAAFEKGGITADEFYEAQGINKDQFMIQMLVRGRQVLYEGLALDALAHKLDLVLTEGDVRTALARIAPGNEEDTQRMLEMNGRLYQLREMAIRLKARRHLLSNAVVTYTTPEDAA